jgi:hypothetical protein
MRQEGIVQRAALTVRLALVVVILVTIAFGYLMLHYHRGTADLMGQLFYSYKYYQKSKTAVWHTIDLEVFTVDTPIEYRYLPLQGIDSFVGRITNSSDTLIFDYGWYSDDFASLDTALYTRSEISIAGKKAQLVQPRQLGKGLIGVYFPEVGGKNCFSMAAFGSTDTATATKIFQSIRFRDTTADD